MFADANARTDVPMTDVARHQWTGVVVSDAGIKVFKADVFLNDRGRLLH